MFIIPFFLGFLVGFSLSLFIVRRPRKALAWGILLVGAPLAIFFLLPGQLQGVLILMGLVAFGPIVPGAIAAVGAVLGMAGAGAVKWAAQGRPLWVPCATGSAIVGIVSTLSLLPVARHEIAERQLAGRIQSLVRADITGTLAEHQVTFPASPQLFLTHNCAPASQYVRSECSTDLTNPLFSALTQNEVAPNERSDPIRFRIIGVSPGRSDCSAVLCLSQDAINNWCTEIRPDQANAIWCRNTLRMGFSFRMISSNEYLESFYQNEPELTARLTDTPLGPARVGCLYSDAHGQGERCNVVFEIDEDISAQVFADRSQVEFEDPALIETLAEIPRYWAALIDE